MGHYFKPLRRKIGFVTLVMACVFAGAWVRSVGIHDLVGVNFSSQSSVFVESSEQTIGFGMERANSKRIWDSFPAWKTEPSSGIKPLDDKEHVRWNMQWHDFGIGGNYQYYPDNFLLEVHAPYWSIVIPLTLLSAWLLILKPRPSTPKKITKPIAEKVA